jgi:D-glycero-alpha-D-manno-heptose-7-phosphate kinase
MITARAPLRISFGGGGTDLSTYYERFGGVVVSSAISTACHVRITPYPGRDILIRSHDYRSEIVVPGAEPVAIMEPLSLPRAVLAWFEQRGQRPSGIAISMKADVPPGSGLGSSSAMTVALVAAIARHLDMPLRKRDTAAAAAEIEIELLGSPIGLQDHYAAAMGGLNVLTFSRRRVEVLPLDIAPAVERSLQDHLLLFSTQRTRHSASVLQGQREASRSDAEVIARLHRIKALAQEMTDALREGDLAGFGGLLDASWQLKRRLATGVTSTDIDRWYALSREHGAYGGKIAGAGGGGFLLLCVPADRRARVGEVLEAQGLRRLPVVFDHQGCSVTDEVIVHSRRRNGAWKREMQDAAVLSQP